MLFGHHVRPADTPEPTDWLEAACRGGFGTVGGLVPNRYPVVLRVHPPDPEPDDWWERYRRLYDVVASIGEQHTTTADRAWFAVWEGHGFDIAATHRALLDVPRFARPHRTYYLLEGAVSAVAQLRHPGSPDEWRNPDLFWPDDRSWFVATDVDFWSLYVGGAEAFIAEPASSVPTRAELVTLDRRFEIED